jgi:hypothetical protein
MIKNKYKMNTVNIFSIVGISIGMFLIGLSFSPDNAQGTICPIDQFAKHLEAANTAYNEQNYVEVKNSLDSMQELVEATEEEDED